MIRSMRIGFMIMWLFFSFAAEAQSGKDGVENVLTAHVVFNRYETVTATIPAGSNTVTVANISSLDGGAAGPNNPYAVSALSYGDLIMVIKMQGALINTSNTAAYGDVTDRNGVGTYELALVRGVTGNTITVCTPFANTFTVSATERVQVVRMPRMSTLIVNPGASIVAAPWSNNKGGVVALEVDGNVAVHGSVSADGAGYHGGALDNNSLATPSTIVDYTSTNDANGAEKGEGIAGSATDYDALNGRYGRGAPANGGGGGNGHNAGGGGGANGGAIASWNGNGNPDLTGANWTNAWDLEAAGFSANVSSGGGRGGYSYATVDLDARAIGPDNATWGGDFRRNVGGKGGRPITYSSNTLFMGGGGGAGDADNNSGGAGGNGGGIVYFLITGSLSGAGIISANGSNGASTSNAHNDAAGGAGAGGAIRLNVSGAISQVNVQSNGGAGGSQLIAGLESDGPGGGGGGGYISVVGNPFITIQADGGANGITTSNAVAEFTPNGATRGGAGTIVSEAFVNAPLLSCFALPLRFVSFMAEADQGNVQLKWVTADESNVRLYEVQTSTDGISWLAISSQAAQNRALNTYTSTLTGDHGLLYLRIRSLDNDGRVQFSEVRAIKQNALPVSLSVQGSSLVIGHVPGDGRELKIYGTGGQLYKKYIINNAAPLRVSVGDLPPGVYYVEIAGSYSAVRLRFVFTGGQ